MPSSNEKSLKLVVCLSGTGVKQNHRECPRKCHPSTSSRVDSSYGGTLRSASQERPSEAGRVIATGSADEGTNPSVTGIASNVLLTAASNGRGRMGCPFRRGSQKTHHLASARASGVTATMANLQRRDSRLLLSRRVERNSMTASNARVRTRVALWLPIWR
jgi:hypothetical protein